jgi:D-galactarolactone isomerase
MHAQSDIPPEPSRRRLVTHAAIAFAAGIIGRPGAARAGEPVPHSSGTDAPRLAPPPGAVDCHIHIYDGRYPAAPTATLHPPDASVADFARLQRRLGTRRVVVVQPSTYGTDNRCTLEAVERMGSAARAVAVVDASVSDAELKRLNTQGVRGIRFNLVQAGATTAEMIEPLARRVAELGWHV